MDIKKYEEDLAKNYTCKITNQPCRNCSKYGCEHRVGNNADNGISEHTKN